jgi:hypothetical protein
MFLVRWDEITTLQSCLPRGSFFVKLEVLEVPLRPIYDALRALEVAEDESLESFVVLFYFIVFFLSFCT